MVQNQSIKKWKLFFLWQKSEICDIPRPPYGNSIELHVHRHLWLFQNMHVAWKNGQLFYLILSKQVLKNINTNVNVTFYFMLSSNVLFKCHLYIKYRYFIQELQKK
jgi:hypothetical protein